MATEQVRECKLSRVEMHTKEAGKRKHLVTLATDRLHRSNTKDRRAPSGAIIPECSLHSIQVSYSHRGIIAPSKPKPPRLKTQHLETLTTNGCPHGDNLMKTAKQSQDGTPKPRPARPSPAYSPSSQPLKVPQNPQEHLSRVCP